MRNLAVARRLLPALIVAQAFMWGSAASAQVDPNIQSTVDSFSVKPSDTILKSETTTETRRIMKPVPLTLGEKREVLKGMMLRTPGITIQKNLPDMTSQEIDAQLLANKRTLTKLVPVEVTKTVTKERTTKIIATASATFDYETNASKSNANRVADSLSAISGKVLMQSPIGPDAYDGTVTLYAGSSSVRYGRLTTKSVDLPGIGFAMATTVSKSSLTAPNGLVSTNVLSFLIDAVSYRQATFGSATANLVSPSFVWNSKNIPIGERQCGDSKNPVYCNSLTFNTTLKHTVADIASVYNSSARVEAVYNRIIEEVAGLSLVVTGGVQANHYYYVVGGRDDRSTDIAAELDWALNQHATIVVSAKYNFARSTVSTVNWDGFGFAPSLRLKTSF